MVIGEVLGAWGNKGEIKVFPHTDFPERFFQMEKVRLLSPEKEEREFVIESVREHQGNILLKLKGIEEIHQAQELRDSYIIIEETERMPLEEDAYYWDDLYGLKVISEEGEVIGRLERVYPGPANDFFEVVGKYGRVLIPAIREVIRQVDLEKRQMIIHLLPGLLEPEEV